MGQNHDELAFFNNSNLINLLWIFAFPEFATASAENNANNSLNSGSSFNTDILTFLGRYMIDLINKKIHKQIEPKIVEQIIRCLFFLKKQDYQVSFF